MLTTIRLYGKLGMLFGRQHRMAVSSPAEAVRALSSQIKGFRQFLENAPFKYGVFIGKRNLVESQLYDPNGDEDIRIAPFAQGAKNGVIQTIVGVVLVVVGYVLTAFGYGAIGIPMVNAGIAMIIGGVIQMLTPMPKNKGPMDDEENRASTQFSGPVNTQAQGNAVSIAYGGPLIIGSAVISASLEAKDNVYIPVNRDPDEYGGGSTRWDLLNQAP